MTLIDLIKRESSLPRNKLVFMALVAGVSNASILGIINSAAQSISKQQLGFRLLVLFVITTVIYAISQRYVFRSSLNVFESIVEEIRNRISDKIRKSELNTLEKLGKSEVYSRLTHGTSTISQTSSVIVAGFQSALIVTFAFAYIATLSMVALVLCAGLIVLGVIVYLKRERAIVPYIKETTRKEVAFFSMITHLLDGFVEHKLNRKRSDALLRETEAVSARLKCLKMKFMDMFIANQVFSQYFMYSIIAVMVFILPRLVPTYYEAINQIAATLLFIIGPLGAVVNSVPAYTNASIALDDVYALETELDAHLNSVPHYRAEDEPRFMPFRELAMEDVEFTYTDKDGRPAFSLGPVNLRVTAGETVFIVGGNGSGKSTIFKLLAGLYPPDRGGLRVNSLLVDEARRQSYRELFSSVISEFYLFDRLYGFNGIPDERVNDWLKQMQLDHKTRFEDGRFTNLDLSTGQRKRLALIVALLEDRPIFLLDEWAAEQDPEFRKHFYHGILADLKSRGKTIIAITHDEHYFHVADRVLKMDYGRFVDR